MSKTESMELEARLAKIKAINDRNFEALANEKWWHMYARGAIGVALTLAILYFTKTFL